MPFGGMLCRNCGFTGVGTLPGHGWLELILWLCYLIPGLIYTAWRRSSRRHICPRCRAPHMVPWSVVQGGAYMQPQPMPMPYGATAPVGIAPPQQYSSNAKSGR